MPSIKDLVNKPSKVPSSRRYPHFYALKNYLKITLERSPDTLKTLLGYTSEDRCRIAVDRLLACDELYEWFVKGHYDFTHTSLSFLERCADIVGAGLLNANEAQEPWQILLAGALREINGSETEQERAFRAEIELAKIEAQRLADLRACAVQAVTDFRFIKGCHSVSTLAYSGNAGYFTLTIKEEWIEKGLKCAFKELPRIIREHFQRCGGKLQNPYGAHNIVRYVVFWKDGDKKRIIKFDTQGNKISDEKQA